MSQTRTYATPDAERLASLRRTVLLVHLLYLASLFVGITSVIGVIVAHVKRGDAAGTIWEGHLTYAIRTFWIGLGLTLLGFIFWFIALGWLVWGLTWLWWLVRMVKALIAWNEGSPIRDPRGFL